MAEKESLSNSSLERLQNYRGWLEEQSLSDHTKRAYESRTTSFLKFLDSSGQNIRSLLGNDESQRATVVRDYRRYLKQKLKLKPESINAHLTAVDRLFEYLGAKKPNVIREEMAEKEPEILSLEEQKRFLRKVADYKRLKDRALALTMFHTGIRIGECVNLDLDDVSVDGRSSRIVVRSASGEIDRKILLNTDTRNAIKDWIAERFKKFEERDKFQGVEIDDALFLNPQGKRLTTTGIRLMLKKIGKACDVDLTSFRLRHSFLTKLLRDTQDLEYVARVAGHSTIDTARRYSPAGPEKRNKTDS